MAYVLQFVVIKKIVCFYIIIFGIGALILMIFYCLKFSNSVLFSGDSDDKISYLNAFIFTDIYCRCQVKI